MTFEQIVNRAIAMKLEYIRIDGKTYRVPQK